MTTVINSNLASINAQRHVQLAMRDQEQAMERLSSGKRINSTRDDAAGLQISNKLTSQQRGLDQAVRNANDGISMVQIAEGALDQTTAVLQRMRELSIQSANGTLNDHENRMAMDAEFKQLLAEIDRIAESTTFNNQPLLNQQKNVSLQVGADANDTVDFSFQRMDTKNLGVGFTDADLVGAAVSIIPVSGTEFKYNDILINNQSLMAPGEQFSAGDSPDILVDAINQNVRGVGARYIATNTIDTVGDGVLVGDEKASVVLTLPDNSTQTYEVKDSHSPEELVEKLNEMGKGAFEASLDDLGRLSVTAEDVYAIKIKAPIGTVNTPGETLSNASFESGSADGWSFDTNFSGLPGDTPASITQTASVTTEDASDGDYSLKLNISGGVTVGYGTAHGPEVTSTAFRAAEGDVLSFDLKALDSGDDYDYYVYMENGETGERVEVQYDRGDNSPWTEISTTVPWESEQIRFVFLNGTYDATGGQAVGSTLYIDDVQLHSDTFFTTTYGQLALSSENGDPVTVQRGTTGSYGDLAALGFRESSSPDTIEGTGITAASIPWGAGDLTLNGVSIVESSTASSLENKIDAINAVSQQTSVRAESFVSAELNLSDVASGSDVALIMNGVTVPTVSFDGDGDLIEVVDAINTVTNQTGIQAILSGQTIQLEGNASSLTVGGSSAASGLGTASLVYVEGETVKTSTALASFTTAETVAGGIKLTSDSGFPISLKLGDQHSIEEHGFVSSNLVGDEEYGKSLKSVNIKTAEQAQQAVISIDKALDMVAQQRGELGAIHNRLEQTIESQLNVSMQVSSARSRIVDADFAVESAALNRAQVTQQAGTAMLAQGIASPQQVLRLLQG